jgi:hypothetical protein
MKNQCMKQTIGMSQHLDALHTALQEGTEVRHQQPASRQQ